MAIDFPSNPTDGQIYASNTKSWQFSTNKGWKILNSMAPAVVSSTRTSYTATNGQTIFTTPTYAQGANQVSLFINGVKQYNTDFTESSNSSITLTSGCSAGDAILIEISSVIGNGYFVANAASIINTSSSGNYYPIFVSSNNGALTIVNSDSSKLYYNPNTGILTATSFNGAFSGTVANTSITGLITSSQIASVANTQVTGLITSNQLSPNLSLNGSLTTSNGFYSTTSFNGSFSDGTLVDYTSGTGRIIVGTTDGLTIYNGGPSSPTPLLSIAANGYFVPAGTASFSGSSSLISSIFNNLAEIATVSGASASGTVTLYVTTQSVLYYTSNAGGNFIMNITGSAGTTLNTLLNVGQCITVAFLNTNGSPAYYNYSVYVDGTTTGVTTKWQGGTAPSSGNTSAIDVYTYTVIKTAASTFTVLASVTKFA